MSNSGDFDFSKFVPGFDFLQTLSKSQGGKIPGMPSWVAPTVDPKEIDKRIEELKAVLFWLDQNGTALKATIQALEVQKMTLATLKGMNLDMSSLATAFATPAKPAAPEAKATATESAAQPKTESTADPMQLWGALTQQFQQIAANAMNEVAKHAHVPASAMKDTAKPASTKSAATNSAAAKPAKAAPRKAAGKTATHKTAASKN